MQTKENTQLPHSWAMRSPLANHSITDNVIPLNNLTNLADHLTDLGNAKRFAAQHGTYTRYVTSRGKWYIYDGKRWVEDELSAVYQLAEMTIQSMYEEAARCTNHQLRQQLIDHAQATESKRGINNMLALAATQPGIACSITQFDRDPMLLNVLNGTIDLRTGIIRSHNPNDMITKIAPVKYDPDAQCPTWNAFLFRIMDGNVEMIRFLKRAVGYSLTGLTNEQCLFFLFGVGANGKSTFVETISYLLGGYAKHAEFTTFTAKQTETVRNDIAGLVGSRFVAASENNEERRFDEALIKQLTGNDTIRARFLYQEYFEFEPEFKIWLSGNHKPIIQGTDDGIWRRIHLIPFTVRIPEQERDKQLKDKLKAELSGILNWAIEGCLEWQKQGLNVPDTVKEATKDYRSEMDIVGRFIEACCVVGGEYSCRASDIYTTFKEWCAHNGESAMSQREFKNQLLERGFDSKRTMYGVMYYGIKVDHTFPV